MWVGGVIKDNVWENGVTQGPDMGVWGDTGHRCRWVELHRVYIWEVGITQA